MSKPVKQRIRENAFKARKRIGRHPPPAPEDIFTEAKQEFYQRLVNTNALFQFFQSTVSELPPQHGAVASRVFRGKRMVCLFVCWV